MNLPLSVWQTGVAQPWPTQQEIREARMEARGERGEVLFGAIDQRVVQGGWPCA